MLTLENLRPDIRLRVLHPLGQRVMDMVDKACGGQPEKLMMALMQYRGLSNEEAERIRQMLDDETHGVKSEDQKTKDISASQHAE